LIHDPIYVVPRVSVLTQIELWSDYILLKKIIQGHKYADNNSGDGKHQGMRSKLLPKVSLSLFWLFSKSRGLKGLQGIAGDFDL